MMLGRHIFMCAKLHLPPLKGAPKVCECIFGDLCTCSRAGASYFRLVQPLRAFQKCELLEGCGGMLPQVLKIRHSEMASEAMFGPKCY